MTRSLLLLPRNPVRQSTQYFCLGPIYSITLASCLIPFSEKLVCYRSGLLLGEMPSKANKPHLFLVSSQPTWYGALINFAPAAIRKLKLFDGNFLLCLSCHWDSTVTLTGVSKGLLALAKGATPDSGGQGSL